MTKEHATAIQQARQRLGQQGPVACGWQVVTQDAVYVHHAAVEAIRKLVGMHCKHIVEDTRKGESHAKVLRAL